MSRIATGGLPNNPRSRFVRPAVTDGARRQSEEQPRSLRSYSTSRPRVAPVQRERVQDTHRASQRRPSDNQDTKSVRRSGGSTSTSSSSSSGSSFWERGTTTSQSSTVTIPSDERMEYEDVGGDGSIKNESAFASYTDTGLVWTRVTEAASALTQEVSKVWATGISLAPLGNGEDEDTQGGESHLTKVMRAYHLSKARTPAELPEWLFSERERGLKGTLRPDPPSNRSQGVPSLAQPAERRNRRDAYHPELPPASERSSQKPPHVSNFTAPVQPRAVGGTDRLKMMREHKRNANNAQGLDSRTRI